MIRRRPVADRRGPGLARTMARTAVIAGTATAASGAVASRQQRRHQAAQPQGVDQLQQQATELQTEQILTQMAPATGDADSPANDLVAQLAALAQLQEKGALTDEEFKAAKAKLIGM